MSTATTAQCTGLLMLPMTVAWVAARHDDAPMPPIGRQQHEPREEFGAAGADYPKVTVSLFTHLSAGARGGIGRVTLRLRRPGHESRTKRKRQRQWQGGTEADST